MDTHSVQGLFDQFSTIFRATGASESDSALIADVLVRAELRSIPSHGVMRGAATANMAAIKALYGCHH
ncbi:MAG: hypothetical protein R6V49_11730 [Bacteroidales bacterium]